MTMSIVDIEYGLCLLLQWIYESKSVSLLFNLHVMVSYILPSTGLLFACNSSKMHNCQMQHTRCVVHFRTVLLVKYSAPHHHDNSWAIDICVCIPEYTCPFSGRNTLTRMAVLSDKIIARSLRSLGVDAHVGHMRARNTFMALTPRWWQG